MWLTPCSIQVWWRLWLKWIPSAQMSLQYDHCVYSFCVVGDGVALDDRFEVTFCESPSNVSEFHSRGVRLVLQGTHWPRPSTVASLIRLYLGSIHPYPSKKVLRILAYWTLLVLVRLKRCFTMKTQIEVEVFSLSEPVLLAARGSNERLVLEEQMGSAMASWSNYTSNAW